MDSIDRILRNLKDAIKIAESIQVTERGRKLLTLLTEARDEIQENEKLLTREKVDFNWGLLRLDLMQVDTSKPRDPKVIKMILGMLPEGWRRYCNAKACACSGCCNPWITGEEFKSIDDRYMVTVRGNFDDKPSPAATPAPGADE